MKYLGGKTLKILQDVSLGFMDGVCDIERRPDGRGDYAVVYADVPCSITALNSNALPSDPFVATFADRGQAGTLRHRSIEIPVAYQTDDGIVTIALVGGERIRRGDDIYTINDAALDETLQVTIVISAEKVGDGD